MLNKVILIGNLGKDPEVKRFENGAVANFNLATNEYYKDKSGNKVQQTEWHNIKISAPGLVDLVEKYFKKGDPIYIEGKIKHREYEKDGVKQRITEIVADTVKFLPKGNTTATTEQKPTAQTSTEPMQIDDDLPF